MPYSRQNLIGYQQAIDKIGQQTSLLPFKFGTLLNEAGLNQLINENLDRFREALVRIKGLP
ncbi:MAG: hypothetical protein HC880_12010 [Bacteroidia bacterium]|nr:hypothetical protein [Bacteroidia bacterium]